MTRKQYQILLDLYHEFPQEFERLSPEVLDTFDRILRGQSQPTHSE